MGLNVEQIRMLRGLSLALEQLERRQRPLGLVDSTTRPLLGDKELQAAFRRWRRRVREISESLPHHLADPVPEVDLRYEYYLSLGSFPQC